MAQPTTTAPAKVKKEKVKKEKVKKEKVERVAFTESPAAKGQLNGDGRLTSATLEGFDRKLHKSPGKDDFADEAMYLDYRAEASAQRANELLEASQRFAQQAKDFRQFGDPGKRSLVKRLQRMRDKMAELEAQLEAEGIEVSDDEDDD